MSTLKFPAQELDSLSLIATPGIRDSKPKTQTHIKELDGVRGLAIALVMIGHGTRYHLLAVSGVSLFFVLSGFLITRILLRSAGKPFYFTNFYIRRSLRIWPLYYLVLAVEVLLHAMHLAHTANPGWRYALYIQNFWSMDSAPALLGPTWSLAIEEQFYLAWPLVIYFCRTPKRAIQVSIALIVLTPLARVLYNLHGIDPYSLTFGRLDGLATGALLAAVSLMIPAATPIVRRWLIACVALALVMQPLMHWVILRKAFKDTSSNLLFVALVGAAFYLSGNRYTAVLRSRVLTYLGLVSYCTYLVHLALITVMPTIYALPLALLIATASWYGFEKPINKLKDRFTRVDPVANIRPASPLNVMDASA